MKFTYKTFLVLFLIISNISCLNTNFDQSIKFYYNKDRGLFPKELTEHFPDDISEGCIELKSKYSPSKLADSCFRPNELYVSIKYNQDNYNILKTKFLQSSYQLNPNDTNLLLIMSYCDVLIVDGYVFRNRENEKTKELARKNSNRDNGIPIPIFILEDFKQVDNPCNLSNDFIIYVIDAQPGIFLDKEIMNECVCMPDTWKHGFSRGVALNDSENIVIYWLEIW